MTSPLSLFPGAMITERGRPLAGNPAATADAIREALSRNVASVWPELAAILGCSVEDVRWTAKRLYLDHSYHVLSMDSIVDCFDYVRTHR